MAGRKKQESAAEAAPKQQTLEEAFAELDTVMGELEKGDIRLCVCLHHGTEGKEQKHHHELKTNQSSRTLTK